MGSIVKNEKIVQPPSVNFPVISSTENAFLGTFLPGNIFSGTLFPGSV